MKKLINSALIAISLLTISLTSFSASDLEISSERPPITLDYIRNDRPPIILHK